MKKLFIFRRVIIGLMLGILFTGSLLPVAAEDYSCNCVLWVRSQTGLPGGPATAAGYTERVMWNFGYKRVSPQGGTIMVWDAYRKGAGSSGHMAIVSNAYYDGGTRKWVINVRHANWGGCGIRTTTFTGVSSVADWGNLDGVNFYARR